MYRNVFVSVALLFLVAACSGSPTSPVSFEQTTDRGSALTSGAAFASSTDCASVDFGPWRSKVKVEVTAQALRLYVPNPVADVVDVVTELYGERLGGGLTNEWFSIPRPSLPRVLLLVRDRETGCQDSRHWVDISGPATAAIPVEHPAPPTPEPIEPPGPGCGTTLDVTLFLTTELHGRAAAIVGESNRSGTVSFVVLEETREFPYDAGEINVQTFFACWPGGAPVPEVAVSVVPDWSNGDCPLFAWYETFPLVECQ